MTNRQTSQGIPFFLHLRHDFDELILRLAVNASDISSFLDGAIFGAGDIYRYKSVRLARISNNVAIRVDEIVRDESRAEENYSKYIVEPFCDPESRNDLQLLIASKKPVLCGGAGRPRAPSFWGDISSDDLVICTTIHTVVEGTWIMGVQPNSGYVNGDAAYVQESEHISSQIKFLIDLKSLPRIQRDRDTLDGCFHNSPLGTACIAHDGRLIRVNRTLSVMLGYSLGEFEGTFWTQFSSLEDWNSDSYALSQVRSPLTKAHLVRRRFYRKDGSRFEANLIACKLAEDADGLPTYLFQIEDATRELQAQELLDHYESQVFLLSTLINAAHDPVFAIDGDSRTLFVNSAGREAIHRSSLLRDVRGRLHFESPLHQRMFNAAIKRATFERKATQAVFPDEGLQPRWWVTVLPINRKFSSADVSAKTAVMMVLHDATAKLHNVQDFLVQGYGLKPAELRLAEALAVGITPEEFATAAGLQITTIRTQLRSIYAKTGTRRQSDVVRMLTDVPRVRRKAIEEIAEEDEGIEVRPSISELSIQLQQIDVLTRISQICLVQHNREEMLDHVLDVIRDAFKVHRAIVIYPHEGESEGWVFAGGSPRIEIAELVNGALPVTFDTEMAARLRHSLESEKAAQITTFVREVDAGGDSIFGSVRSQVTIALRPKGASPWLLCLQHCESIRHFNGEEIELLSAIAARVSDALTALISVLRLRDNEVRFKNLFDNSPIGLFHASPEGWLTLVNPALTRMLGYETNESVVEASSVVGCSPICVRPEHRAEFVLAFQNANGWKRIEGEFRRKDGSVVAVNMEARSIKGADGKVAYFEGFVEDVSLQRTFREQVWEKSNLDQLTKLPNRFMFDEKLQQEIGRASSSSEQVALLIVDLDRFKEINDTLGHHFGDKVLQNVARRIESCVHSENNLARLGGDEFAVILSGEFVVHAASTIADAVIHRLRESFQIDGETTYVSASVGIAIYPDDAPDAQNLLKKADQAMYAAKSSGRDRYSHVTKSLQEVANARLEIAKDLRTALARGQFSVVFQPIVELTSRGIAKAEALIRWNHPVRGWISPTVFIRAAEESGLICEIGEWVFAEALRWTSRWVSLGYSDLCISINKSPIEFRSQNGSTDLLSQIHSLGLDGKNVSVEITEGILFNENAEVLNKLWSLPQDGVTLAIDDFGTGYSSLSYLHKFNIDFLKIDQSFVRDLETDPAHRALSRAIIVMAHELGLKVIAEGVETEAQGEYLRSFGCDFAQGYLYSKPLDPEAFETMLGDLSTSHKVICID